MDWPWRSNIFTLNFLKTPGIFLPFSSIINIDVTIYADYLEICVFAQVLPSINKTEDSRYVLVMIGASLTSISIIVDILTLWRVVKKVHENVNGRQSQKFPVTA